MSTKPLFTDFGLDEDLTDALRDRGIVHPFPIQELTLPLALKGHDIIGQARTGTGKTLGFGLPLLQRIDTSKAKTQALVIVPTRELCIQVAEDLTVGADRGITTIAVYGGVGYDEQIEALTTGVHVVIGTPGRTIDHLNRGNLDVSQIHTVVLDEADEMLDMGFLPDVERLLADVPDDRQTLLFSATMPTEIVKLARRFMAKPTFMRADETLHETAPEVDQHFFLVHRMDKPRVLARLLQKPDRGGAFVFCRTKRMCDRLVQELADLGVAAIAVHGDLRQSSREKNLDRFRDGKADVLVATEVAARGLDVSNVTYVVNYDCPDDEKMYLHRIGRTARAGQSGVAVTFAEFNEVDRVNVIRKRVAVEEEMVEVFSTSDELTALFDLPETTPWDDLATSSRSGSSRSSSPRTKSSGTNRSSGRSGGSGKTSRDNSGRGSGRGRGDDRGRGRGDDTSGGRTRRTTSDRADDTSPSTDEGRGQRDRARDGGGDRSRGRDSTRSRSRSRTRTTTDTSTSRSRGDRGSRTSRDASDSAGDGSGSGSGSQRTRARSADRRRSSSKGAATSTNGTTRDGSGDRAGGRSAGGDTRSGDTRSGDNADRGGDASGRTRARRTRDRDDRPAGDSSGNGGGRARTSDDANARRADRATEGEDQSTSGRARQRASSGRSRGGTGNGSTARTADDDRSGRSGRSNDRRGDRGGTSGSDRADDGRGRSGRDTTTRGDDARGEGTPRPRRRVAVEHLP